MIACTGGNGGDAGCGGKEWCLKQGVKGCKLTGINSSESAQLSERVKNGKHVIWGIMYELYIFAELRCQGCSVYSVNTY